MGWPNVDAMLREMTAQQFDEWLAYYQLEPFGILAEDAEWAHWKAIYTGVHTPKGKRVPKPEKFLIFGEKKTDASNYFEAGEGEDL